MKADYKKPNVVQKSHHDTLHAHGSVSPHKATAKPRCCEMSMPTVTASKMLKKGRQEPEKPAISFPLYSEKVECLIDLEDY